MKSLKMFFSTACIATLLSGCPKPPAPEWPAQASWPDQVLMEDGSHQGTSAWMTTFATPVVRLGACATNYGVATGKACVQQPADVDTKVTQDALTDGQYQYFSRSIDVDFSASVGTAAASGSTKVVVESHQLIMQWARWKERKHTYQPNEQPKGALVERVRVGVGARLVFDVMISRVEGKAGGSFGLGDMATALAARNATVRVALSTLGISNSVLPSRSPIIIASANEFADVMLEFYETVKKLNAAVAAHSGALDGDILAYYVVNMSYPALSAPYSAGYVAGLQALASGKRCATAHPEVIKLFPGLSEDDAASFLDGMAEVYAVFTAAPGCGDYPIGVMAKKAAKNALVEGALLK